MVIIHIYRRRSIGRALAEAVALAVLHIRRLHPFRRVFFRPNLPQMNPGRSSSIYAQTADDNSDLW